MNITVKELEERYKVIKINKISDDVEVVDLYQEEGDSIGSFFVLLLSDILFIEVALSFQDGLSKDFAQILFLSVCRLFQQGIGFCVVLVQGFRPAFPYQKTIERGLAALFKLAENGISALLSACL